MDVSGADWIYRRIRSNMFDAVMPEATWRPDGTAITTTTRPRRMQERQPDSDSVPVQAPAPALVQQHRLEDFWRP